MASMFCAKRLLWITICVDPKYFVRTGIGLPWKTVETRESSVFCQKAKVSKPKIYNKCRRTPSNTIDFCGACMLPIRTLIYNINMLHTDSTMA
jgi:hypothetical protein